MKTFKLISPLAACLALLGIIGGATAQTNPGYVVDTGNNVVKSGTGLCWRTSAWTPASATYECDPGLMPKPVAAVPMAQPVAVAAVAAPKPAPKMTWQTKITQTPVRLDGASFDVGSSRLKGGDIPGLRDVVETAAEHPEILFAVEGYTSNTGGEEMNQRLSEDRAQSVKRYLVDKGVDAARVTTKGFGEANPIGNNDTVQAREDNRRVEIRYTVTEETRVRAMQR